MTPYFGKSATPEQTEPVTFRESMLNTFVSKGLTSDEAETLMAFVEPKLHHVTTKMLDEQIKSYPHSVHWGIWVSVRGYALDWIESNKPDLSSTFFD